MTPSENRRGNEQRGFPSAARAGDERAFASLLDAHQSGLELFCQLMLGDPDAVRHAMAEIALVAWRDRGNVHGQSTERIWLYRIAAHACIAAADDAVFPT